MNPNNILLLLSILLFSLTCDETTLPKDCLGIEGGLANIDECGVCDDDANNDNITCLDCDGEINGTNIYDECIVCDNYSTYGGVKPSYPYGACDCNGDGCDDPAARPPSVGCMAIIDDCGICDGPGYNEYGCCPHNSDIEKDCAGTCGGDFVEDECGECNGDGSTCCANIPACEQPTPDCDGADDCECVNNDLDCDGVCHGNGSTATNDGSCCPSGIIDNCGVCEGDDTSCLTGCTNEAACNYNASIDPSNDDGSCEFSPLNYDCDGNCSATIDCTGECGGGAIIDCSGECRGGNTGLLAYTICACFEIDAVNFYCHQDADECYNNPSANTCCENNTSVDLSCHSDCIRTYEIQASGFSNPFIDSEDCDYSPNPFTFNTGCVDDYENPNYGLVYNDTSLCEYYGCTDDAAPNHMPEATNCEDGTDSCCSYTNYIEIQNIDTENSTFEIFMNNDIQVGGFQIDFENGILSGASGGSGEDAGFTVSEANTTVVGFSLESAAIPEGSGLLTSLIFDNSPNICISSIIISDVLASPLSFNIHYNSLCE